MKKEMLINVSEGEECRIALLEGGHLEELYMERTSSTSHVGNIYIGRVTNVEASIQAAFVDFGLGRNGFLHISDLMPSYFGGGRRGDDVQETVGRKMARRDRPPIQRCLRRGDDIIVQIIKEGIGTKGPTLSTYLSIPGRILVMMPGMAKMGVSRKIEDETERRRLRQILDSLKPPDGVGFIIRTAGVGKSKTEIQRDLTYLTRLWQTLVKKRDSGPAPMELYTEGDLVTRTVRDVFTSDIDRVVVDNKEVAKRVKEVIKLANPRTKNKVDLYEEAVPLFHQYGIEREIELMYSRHVPLPSGGSLVIDSTEAIVAIDVNSGKFRDHSDAETTAFKTDMEAADEIPRQLRLRDLGGVIICDFIDLRYERHRRELEKRLHDNFQNDRAKTKVLRMSQFGIIEMTRQRMRPSLKRSIYFDCPHCKGAGLVKTPESMSLDVMRRVAIAINDLKVARVELTISADVNFYLQNKKRAVLASLEEQHKKRVIVRADAHMGLDEMRLDLYDARDGLVFLDELATVQAPPVPHTTQLGTRPHAAPPQRRGGRPSGRFEDRRQRTAEPQRVPPSSRDDDAGIEDRFDLERLEEQVDEREERIERAADEAGAPSPMIPDAPREAEHETRPDIDTEAASEAAEPGDIDQEDENADPAGEAGEGMNGQEGEGGVRRRRRRRRGRRGRGGRGGEAPAGRVEGTEPHEDEGRGGLAARFSADDAAAREKREEAADGPEPEAHDDEFPDDVAEVAEGPEALPSTEGGEGEPAGEEGADESGPRRRRRRGGRGRRRGRAANGEPVAEPEAKIDRPNLVSVPPVVTREEKPAAAPRGTGIILEEVQVVRTGSTDRHLQDEPVSDEPVLDEPVLRPRSYRDLDHIPDDLD